VLNDTFLIPMPPARLLHFDHVFTFTSCLVPLKVLCYLGAVDAVNKKGQVELQRYKKDHPFAQLSGSDNIIAFTTSRYKEQPLMVRGPGAGAEVTAGGVFCDILQLVSYLGAPS
jgi:bifunctional aspartokinase / homoserine dehydrogenase 1